LVLGLLALRWWLLAVSPVGHGHSGVAAHSGRSQHHQTQRIPHQHQCPTTCRIKAIQEAELQQLKGLLTVQGTVLQANICCKGTAPNQAVYANLKASAHPPLLHTVWLVILR
jgi:hypothetical protein